MNFLGKLTKYLASNDEKKSGAAQELGNTAWAFGAATQSDAMLFAALARAVERRLGAFIAQALANTAWAFGTATQSDAMLFAAMANVV